MIIILRRYVQILCGVKALRFSGLSIRQLEAFEAFMETRSVSGAALQLHISQPSVSRLLQELEADTQLHLFDRSLGRLIPTHQAILFFAEVATTFRSAHALMKAARDIKELKRGTVRIGALAAASFDLVPGVLGALKASSPEAKMTLTVRHSRDIAASVAARLSDVGIIDDGVPRPDTLAVAIHQIESICVMDAAHPLRSKKRISLADVAQYPFVSLDPAYYARTVDGMQLNKVVEGRIVAESFQSFVACAFVTGNDALSIVDPLTARFYAPHGLISRPVNFSVPLRFAVIQNSYSITNNMANRFVALLNDRLQALTK
jgi:DNA-binding transcriptional LysR family regulator